MQLSSPERRAHAAAVQARPSGQIFEWQHDPQGAIPQLQMNGMRMPMSGIMQLAKDVPVARITFSPNPSDRASPPSRDSDGFGRCLCWPEESDSPVCLSPSGSPTVLALAKVLDLGASPCTSPAQRDWQPSPQPATAGDTSATARAHAKRELEQPQQAQPKTGKAAKAAKKAKGDKENAKANAGKA